jgi:alpha-galactosidase
MMTLTFVCLLFFIPFSDELNNGLGRTPQMGKKKKEFIQRKDLCIFFSIEGWNSWNHFHCSINETVVRQTADTIAATGLAAAGYQYGQFFSYFLHKNYYLSIVFHSELR